MVAELGNASKIIALGGGAVAQPENLRLLQDARAKLVFLDAPVEELFRRCEQQERKRPLQGDPREFRELYQQRRPYYMTASWRIDTGGKDLESIAAEVVCSLGLE